MDGRTPFAHTQSDFQGGPLNPYSSSKDTDRLPQFAGSHFLSPALNDKASASDISLARSDDDAQLNPAGSRWQNNPRKHSRIREILFPDSFTCRLYLLAVVLETIFDLAIEAILLARVNSAINQSDTQQGESSTLARNPIPVYLGVFGMAHVFQFILALDAVYSKNVLQFVFLAIFNALFFLYAVIQIFEVESIVTSHSSGFLPSEGLTIAIPVVVSIAEIAYVGLAYRIYQEFGWQVFKLLGADRQIKRMHAQYQILQCLMRFDLLFWMGFSIQLIALVLAKGDFEFYLTIAALPLSILLVFEGHLAARHESRWMMGIFGFGLSAGMVYFVYKLIRIWTQRYTDTFKNVYKTLTVFAAISVLLLILTAIWSWIVYRNFDGGLKHHLNKRKKESDEVELGPKGGFKAGNPNRMSIE
ncbi:hypothetical protein DL93DRAFT_2074485 [Clavulina sp. PMI_390]|nr:hypothetical protein DL93DRAFT_2074485 [Clavulina sp. PMI_390]